MNLKKDLKFFYLKRGEKDMRGKIALGLSLLLVMLPLAGILPTFANSTSESKWTFMVYMDADNNLDSAGIDDISEMQTVGSTDEVDVVVLFDRYAGVCGFNGTEVLYIGKGYNETVFGGWSDENELNMGDPETLTWFINYTVDNYPADKYALIIWDHGGNWEGVSWDWTDNDYLTVEEVRSAIEASIIGRIDILGFDACLMGSAEVAYTMGMSNKVDVMVASEDFIPWDGWPYDLILEDLTTNPDWNSYEFSSDIVNQYITSYANVPVCKVFATLSAINLTYMDALVSSMGSLTSELLEGFNTYKGAITGAKNEADRYWFGMWHQGAYIDLYQFISTLGTTEGNLKPYTDSMLQILNSAVINSECCNGPHIRGCGGLTIYFPRNRNLFYNPEPYYDSVPKFAEQTGWYNLLTQYFATHSSSE